MTATVPDGYHSILDVFNDIGKRVFKEDWTGDESKFSKNLLNECEKNCGKQLKGFNDLEGKQYPLEEWENARGSLGESFPKTHSLKITRSGQEIQWPQERIEMAMRATVILKGLRAIFSVFSVKKLTPELLRSNGAKVKIPKEKWLATDSGRAIFDLQNGTVEYDKANYGGRVIQTSGTTGTICINKPEYEAFIKTQFPETPIISPETKDLIERIVNMIKGIPEDTPFEERLPIYRELRGKEYEYIEFVDYVAATLRDGKHPGTKQNNGEKIKKVDDIKKLSETLKDETYTKEIWPSFKKYHVTNKILECILTLIRPPSRHRIAGK